MQVWAPRGLSTLPLPLLGPYTLLQPGMPGMCPDFHSSLGALSVFSLSPRLTSRCTEHPSLTFQVEDIYRNHQDIGPYHKETVITAFRSVSGAVRALSGRGGGRCWHVTQSHTLLPGLLGLEAPRQ